MIFTLNVLAVVRVIAITQCLFAISSHAAELYRYQDAGGKWHYTDKKPEKMKVESVSYKTTEKSRLEPKFFKQMNQQQSQLMVENPFHAPIEFSIRSSQIDVSKQHRIIPAKGIVKLLGTVDEIQPYTYSWMLGDPNITPGAQIYDLPVSTITCHEISQAFHGKFSHHHASSEFAVDIVMPVGTPIIAAREGIVVSTKDDYHMGGVNKYFLDKANHIRVLHSDGTFANYFHILLGTAAVKVGDQVLKGTVLAKSGSSGYSSGPHLHFVIQKNSGMRMNSIMFNFNDNKGNAFIPIEGKTICNF